MRNVEQVSSVKSELLDIFMSMEVVEHQQRQKSAAVRNLRARRGIELHNEFKRLEQDIAELDVALDDDVMQ
ncbi:PA3496 family putative envelope integrity protein [Onishia taeanensis]